MGAPAFKIRKQFKASDLKIYSSNYTLYGDLSHRVTSILRTYCPDLEIYSIDESFLHFTGFEQYDLRAHAIKMRKEVLQYTLIPTCVGIAPTKALAKVANAIAKKFPELEGVYAIDSEEKRVKALKWLPIEDVWGIGRKWAKKLKAQGIHKAYDFTIAPDAWVQKNYSIVGLRLKKELEGRSVSELEYPPTKKSIATTRSFDTTYTDKEYIRERISTFAASCAEKLRQQHTTCALITVFIYTNRFQKGHPQYYKSINLTMPFATHSSIEIIKQARKGFEAIFKPGYAYKKAGVIVSGLAPEHEKQYNLFEEEPIKHPNLMKVIDKLNVKYGDKKIKVACQALDKTWKMRQEHRSPNYTTAWKDLLTIT